MTLMEYVCGLINRHMQLSRLRTRSVAETNELEWLSYKLKRVKNAQRKVIYGVR
ncbi:hypothetical protein [Marinilactibacillus psychrotolerans]|uniref:hypothetical protein n=1 Tax=Marinilactibacillus psychrotolerans TaxID=191770 RepID=UPI001486FFB7|nr:hypothetical protein [Marinilactibacillus psychrotolerans]